MKYKIFNSLEEANQTIPRSKNRLILVDGHRICVAHTAAGLFAVADSCPHLGESLSKGTNNYLNEIVCPWHSYRFSLTTGTECKNRTANLKTYSLSQEPDGVYLEF